MVGYSWKKSKKLIWTTIFSSIDIGVWTWNSADYHEILIKTTINDTRAQTLSLVSYRNHTPFSGRSRWVQRVRLNPLPPVFLNIPWKWNNLVSDKLFHLKSWDRSNQQSEPHTFIYRWTPFPVLLDPPLPLVTHWGQSRHWSDWYDVQDDLSLRYWSSLVSLCSPHVRRNHNSWKIWDFELRPIWVEAQGDLRLRWSLLMVGRLGSAWALAVSIKKLPILSFYHIQGS